MTTKDWKKQVKMLSVKPPVMNKYIKHNQKVKRSCGIDLHHCIKCNRTGGHISKYGIHLCRLCFREYAKNIGFKKYS
jgi:ribosomal protein S14